jgi:hypothetical protein
MTISFQCTGCDRTLKVSDELAGRKAKCPKCQTILFIPEGKKAAISTAPTRKRTAPAPRPEEPEEGYDEAAGEAPEEEAPRRGKKGKKSKKAQKSLLLPLLLAGGAVLVVLFGSGSAFALWWFFWPAAAPEDAYFFPDGTQLVAQVHTDQLMASGAIQQAREAFPDFNQKLVELSGQSATGDPANAGDVYFAFQAIIPGAGSPGFVAIQRFKQPTKAADVQAGYKRQNSSITFTETKVGRYTVYDFQMPNAATGVQTPISFVMADDKREVSGPTSLLHTVLQRDKKVDLPDKLQATIKQTDFTATVAVAATKDFIPRGGLMAGMPGMPGPGGRPGAPPPAGPSPLDKVDGWSLTAKVANDVDLTVTAMCQDAQSANDLRDNAKKGLDQLKAVVALGALTGNAPAGLSDMLDINMQVTGSNVTVNKTIEVAPLIKMVKDQQQKAAVPPVGFPPIKPGK